MLSQKRRRRLGLVAWMAMLCLTLAAQPDDPHSGRRPAKQVPLEGIEWLLVVGGLVGARKIMNRRG